MWTIFKAFTESVTILILFYVLVFWLWVMWDLSSPDQGSKPQPLHWKAKSQAMDPQVSPWIKMKVTQSCPTLCDPMNCSLPGSFALGILQARILEWVAVLFSRVSSQPSNQTQLSCIEGEFFTIWATREAHSMGIRIFNIITVWTETV